MLYVDDGVFTFELRHEAETGANLIWSHFRKFGLEMHICSTTCPSKTECLFFPTPSHFYLPPLPSTTPHPGDLLELALRTTEERDQLRRKQEDQLYDHATETRDIVIGTAGRITFCRHFKYLGSHISYHLRDDVDINHCIAKASAEMGSLNPFWTNPAVNLKSKYLMFCAIPTNLLL